MRKRNGGFFDMTRRERWGTIVLLVVIGLLTIGTIVVKKGTHQRDVAVAQSVVSNFEQEADSMAAAVVDKGTKNSKKMRVEAKKSKPHRRDEAHRGAPSQRPVEPVPQF